METERMSTAELIKAIRKVRSEAGSAWGHGFVDPDVADMAAELQRRGTKAANAALDEFFPDEN